MFVDHSYDQASLDSQYNNRLHVPDYPDYLDRWEKQSRATARKLPVVKDVPYGPLEREKLDIYPSPQPQSKTLLFIHGGYWQMLDKTLFHFIADAFHPYGITTVFLGYPLSPQVSMEQIVESCRKAVLWLHHHVSGFNGDPHQLYLAGHSAGGHLAAMLLTTNRERVAAGAPVNLLKGACLLSGLFDLVPIQLSYLNKVLMMDRETAIRNSPVRMEPLAGCPLIVAVGEAETTAFIDQSKAFYTCWKEKGSQVRFLPLPGQNHYSIVDMISNPTGALHTAIVDLMEVDTFLSR